MTFFIFKDVRRLQLHRFQFYFCKCGVVVRLLCILQIVLIFAQQEALHIETEVKKKRDYEIIIVQVFSWYTLILFNTFKFVLLIIIIILLYINQSKYINLRKRMYLMQYLFDIVLY